ncbi:hypothetical protein [Streptantibioticus cattleyicolor]|uniref:Uncharacterized protein n=1 Tax=Streptantibioticus cattleyicolor (strain ATCC 35852 / DSM 46488 / JCM 4925 / NBRC 14057 / NRRL 8057) TaxID=1003195 RepID=F8JNP2_STREN|nr:hypothetical protein [Streptantibioticus cattleyicolor]AEW98989.1 hypothetical protein SCATT_p07960 [Streptantibioticus cattleyicolor NRRL 8057 = DSM 46488]CCB71968.1 protein of unknown function [Streptantibioticus cattleyicolor NRRL 8057 = DSM 46488]
MSLTSNQLSTSAVAIAAGLSESWAWKARDQGVLYEPHFEDSVVALRVYAFVSQIVWPGVRRPRSARQELELWQSSAVEAAREAASDPNTTPDTALWVLEDSVHLVTTPAKRAAFDLEHLGGRVAFRIPVGLWVSELPDAIANLKHRRRRPQNPKSAA